MVCGSVSLEGLAADRTQPKVRKEEIAEAKEVSDQVESHAGYAIPKEDVIAEENTEFSTTYDAGNGVLVTEFYGQKVCFWDEAGELVDYDASLVEVEKEESI